ncbi:MAG: hypothetical protein WBN22_10635 [Verrucomicrobiia bacterium]
MNSKEVFMLFLRVVGILGGLFIVRHVLETVSSCTPSAYLIIKWVVGVLVALYLIRGAPWLVKFAYPAKHLTGEP